MSGDNAIPLAKVDSLESAFLSKTQSQTKYFQDPIASIRYQDALQNEYEQISGVHFGHNGPVKSILITSNSQKFISASKDRTIIIWRTLDRKIIHKFKEHTDEVSCLALTKNDDFLVSGSFDCSAKVWNMQNYLCILTLTGHEGPITSVDTQSGQILTASEDKTIKIWDTTGQLIHTLEGHVQGVYEARLTLDCKKIISCSKDSTVKIWDLQKGVEIACLTKHETHVVSVCISPDGKKFASCGEKDLIVVWDLQTYDIEIELKAPDALKSLKFSSDGNFLVHTFNNGHYTTLWDLNLKRQTKTIMNYPNKMNSIAISHDSKVIIGGSEDKIINITYLEDIASPSFVIKENDNIKSLSLSKCGNWSLYGSGRKGKLSSLSSDDNHLSYDILETSINAEKVYDLVTESELVFSYSDFSKAKPRFPISHSVSMHFSMISSDYLISCHDDGTLKIWNLNTRKLMNIFKIHLRSIWTSVICLKKKLVITGGVDKIKGFDYEQKEIKFELTGHNGKIYALVLNKTEDILFSSCEDGNIKVWNIEQQVEVANIKTAGVIFTLILSENDEHLIGGSEQGYIYSWAVQNWEVEFEKYSKSGVRKLIFAYGEKYIIAGLFSGEIKVWDFENKNEFFTVKGHTAWIKDICFLQDSDEFISCGDDKLIILWNFKTQSQIHVFKEHTNSVYKIGIDKKNTHTHLISSSEDGTIKIWNLTTKKFESHIQINIGNVTASCFSADSKMAYFGTDKKMIAIIDVTRRKVVYCLVGHTGNINCLNAHANGKLIASGSTDKTIRVWNVIDYKEEVLLTGHTGEITSIAFTPNGKALVSSSNDFTIKLWNLSSKNLEFTFSGHTGKVMQIKISPQKKLLFSCSIDKSVKCWSINDKKLEYSFGENTHEVSTISISNDEKIAVWASLNVINVWSIDDRKVIIKVCDLVENAINRLDFRGNSYDVVSISGNCLKCWNFELKMKDIEIKQTYEYCYRSLAYSNINDFVACGRENGDIVCVEFSTGIVKHVFESHTKAVRDLILTQEDSVLISASEDCTIKVWSINKKKLKCTLKSHESEIYSIALIKNATLLLSSSWDSNIKLWDFKNKSLILTFFTGTYEIYKIIPYNDDSYVYICSQEPDIKSFDLKEGINDHQLTGHENAVYMGTLNKSQTILYTSSQDATIKAWDISTHNLIFSMSTSSEAYLLLLMKNEKYLVTCQCFCPIVQVYDLESRSEIQNFTAHKGMIRGLMKRSDDEFISSSYDGSVKFWKLGSEVESDVLLPCLKKLTCLSLSRSSDLAFLSTKSCIYIYSILEKKFKSALESHEDQINAILPTEDPNILITCSNDKTIKIWSFFQKKILHSFPKQKSDILCLSLANSLNLLLCGMRDGIIKVWKMIDKTEAFVLTGHRGAVKSLAITSDNIILVSGSSDSTIRIWNLREKHELYVLNGHSLDIEKILLVQSEKFIASCSLDQTIKIWNLEKHRENFTLNGHQGGIVSLVETPDKNYLISGAEDWTIRFWSISDRKQDFVFKTTSVYCLYLSYDGKYLCGGAAEDVYFTMWKLRSGNDYEVSTCPIAESNLNIGFNNIHFTGFKNSGQNEMCSEFSPKSICDSYAQDTMVYENAKSALKNKNFGNLLTGAADVSFGKFLYTILHFACLNGDDQLLSKLTESPLGLRADVFGKSPIYYAIVKRNHKCIDILIEYLALLCEKPDSKELHTSLYSIKNDFPLIILNSSSKLCLLLQNLLLTSSVQFSASTLKLPATIFNNNFEPNSSDFTIANLEEGVLENPTIITYTYFELPASVGSNDNMELLDSICNCEDQRVFNAPLIQNFVQFQWDSVKSYIRIYSMLLFINLILLLFILQDGSDTSFYIIYPFLGVNGMLFIWEFIQICLSGLDYFKDVWNYIDTVRFFLTISWILLLESNHYILTWTVVLINFIRGLTGFRLFDGTRYYVRLILRALNDIKYFMIMFCYSIITFGTLFSVTGAKNVNFTTLWYDPYGLNFGMYTQSEVYPVLEHIVYVCATFMQIVLMLNLLVSILGDSHEQFQLEKSMIDYREKAELSLEIQKMMFWARGQVDKGYMQVMCEVDSGQKEEMWEGRIVYLEKKIDKIMALENENTGKMINAVFEKIAKSQSDNERNLDRKINPIKSEIEEGMRKNAEDFGKAIKGLEDKIGSSDKCVKEMDERLKRIEEMLCGLKEKIDN